MEDRRGGSDRGPRSGGSRGFGGGGGSRNGGGGGRGGFGGGGGQRRSFNDGPRELHDATCSDCGQETKVPFKPSGDRPVYCRDCFAKHKPPSRDRF